MQNKAVWLIGLLGIGCSKSPIGLGNTPYNSNAVWVAAGQSNMSKGFVTQDFQTIMQQSGRYGQVSVINVAVGGTFLSQWKRGTPYYNSMLEALHTPGVQGLLWWQGENEGVYGPANTWAQDFETMIKQLRKDSGISDLKVVYVRINNFSCGPYWSQIREQQSSVELSNATMIDIDDIPPEDSAECVHFNSATPAYGIVAQRMADIWLEN